MSELRFDGRVAIVTGAGGGLGRQHALTLAARGCKVVVNDLGGSAHGAGQSSSAADKVVDEIKAMGGEAVANYDSVENGAAIVKTALDHFGTVDIVVNNAGILRDVSFAKMTKAEWDIIQRVHLDGSMSVTHAAWPIMREKGYGRIVMTTSAAGIYGNFGQANYCAAKLGIHGLAQCLAEEGRGKNILVNTIAPLAASRLTETVMPPELLKLLQPEAVSPLVAWLCHEDCEETKGLFEVGAGYIGKLRWERAEGHFFANGKPFSIDDVARRWDAITDFSTSTHPDNVNASFGPILDGVNNPKLGGNEFIDLDLAKKSELVLENSYDERDLALYALGIGAARDPLDKDELKYVYELGGDFSAMPTYGAMPMLNAMLAAAKGGEFEMPGMNFGFDRLLHGEQYIELKRPLPPHAKLKNVFRFKEAFDKAPNAIVTFSVSTQDESGEEIAYNEMTSFVKGAGGWGGDRGPSGDINVPPAREPDAVIEEKTDANQTLLYRLSGDWNPLHADPDFARAFGFEAPILHGMCTFGHCGRHVIKAFCNNDGRYFKSIKVRFAKSVFPGDTLVTRMWKESDTRIVFETIAKERNEVVIKNAVVELHKELPVAKPKAPATAAANAAPAATEAPRRLIAEDVFGVLTQYVGEHPELVEQTKTAFQFRLKNPDSVWTLDLKNGSGSCTQGDTTKPDVTLEMDEEHLGTVVTSSLADVQKLFFGGQLKIGGNVMASNKLVVLQAIKPQRFEDAMNQRLAQDGGAPPAATAQPAADESTTLADIFSGVAAYIGNDPSLVEKTKTTFQFLFANPDSSYFIDLKNGKGSAGSGSLDKADVTLAMDTQYVDTLFGGDIAAIQKLFFGGQLKITGNVMASNKLGVLSGMDPKLVDEARKQRLASGSAAPAAAAAQAKRAASAPAIFEALGAKLQQHGATGDLNQVVRFHVRDPEAFWTVDFGATPPTVVTGDGPHAVTQLGIDDGDLADLVRGNASARSLYQQGKLRVDGEVAPAHALDIFKNLI